MSDNNHETHKAEKRKAAAEAVASNAQAVVADLEAKRASARLGSKKERENREAQERFAASQRKNNV